MRFFLTQYDRTARQAHVTAFDDEAEALRELRLREAAREPNVEVVLLMARSEDDLRRTHARYFSGIEALFEEVAALSDELAAID